MPSSHPFVRALRVLALLSLTGALALGAGCAHDHGPYHDAPPPGHVRPYDGYHPAHVPPGHLRPVPPGHVRPAPPSSGYLRPATAPRYHARPAPAWSGARSRHGYHTGHRGHPSGY